MKLSVCNNEEQIADDTKQNEDLYVEQWWNSMKRRRPNTKKGQLKRKKTKTSNIEMKVLRSRNGVSICNRQRNKTENNIVCTSRFMNVWLLVQHNARVGRGPVKKMPGPQNRTARSTQKMKRQLAN